MMIKPKIFPTPFSGCFGCYMSFLDTDEHLAGLLEHVELIRPPLIDIKHCCPFDFGLIESGVYNAESVPVLHHSSTPKTQ
ncbi:hypothetical protein [Nitrosomonas sp.]|uniref:hypothetical protein n=1 Tax=Nitrosomonas sp. TaxID=42353 RepID=UPI0025FCA864|nr:hypothetical protein [Nitrosomonas sp.]MBY0484502.1 hypothetical protein [Nitrosomonas sp.]